MPIHVLTGSDASEIRGRITELCAGADVYRFELCEDQGRALVDAAQTYSLFGHARALVGQPLSDLSAELAGRLAVSSPEDLVILYDSSAPSAAVRKALAGAMFETCSLPSPRNAALRVQELACSLGIQLDESAQDLLTKLAPSAWDAVRGSLTRLRELNVTVATTENVRPFLGTSTATATAWALSDAIERGDTTEILSLCATIQPTQAVSYLARRAGVLSLLLESGDLTPATACTLLGTASIAAGRRLVEAARVGHEGAARAAVIAAAADRDVKTSSDPRATLLLAALRLARIWSR